MWKLSCWGSTKGRQSKESCKRFQLFTGTSTLSSALGMTGTRTHDHTAVSQTVASVGALAVAVAAAVCVVAAIAAVALLYRLLLLLGQLLVLQLLPCWIG